VTLGTNIVVLGSQGQVGRELVRQLEGQGAAVRGLNRLEADLSDPETTISALRMLQPSVVINAAAYTAVDLAETERDLALKVNGEAPGVIAKFCADLGVPFVHYSTDYVFPGTGVRPWEEADPVEPLNFYGRTKLVGEESVRAAGGKWLILRTSWVYAQEGKNFVRTMLKLGAEREELRVVNDQVGAPTFAAHLARATLQTLVRAQQMKAFPSGTYHACNSGETNWREFAVRIFDEARSRGTTLRVRNVQPILTADYPTPARRPLNSRMSTKKLSETLGVTFPHWSDGLKECMEQLI
jgi:dTDP-4-dehydrorhamnose reductase